MAKKRGRNKQFRCDTIDELRAAFDEIKSIVAGDTRFMAQALMFLAERSVVSTPDREKRPSTEWQKFFAKGMRAGKVTGADSRRVAQTGALKEGRVRYAETTSSTAGPVGATVPLNVSASAARLRVAVD